MRIIKSLIITIIIIVCLAVLYYSNRIMFGARAELNEERYLRMLVEEKLEKSKIRIAELDSQLSSCEKKNEKYTLSLEQTNQINEELKNRLKVTENEKTNLEKTVEELKKNSANKKADSPQEP